METSPDGIKEVLDYAYQLHLQIEEDMKSNEYTYAMHKLKAMAHTYIDALKNYPDYWFEVKVNHFSWQCDCVIRFIFLDIMAIFSYNARGSSIYCIARKFAKNKLYNRIYPVVWQTLI